MKSDKIVYFSYQSKETPKKYTITLKKQWKNIESSYNNNKFKILALTWNDKSELPDGSYSVSNIQDYFECILKKHGENIEEPSV